MSTDSPGPLQVLADLVLKISYIKANKVTKMKTKNPEFFFRSNSTYWVPMDSPGPQQSRFGNLTSLRTTWTPRTPRVCEGHFAFLVPSPYNIGVYGLPWTPAVKIWKFDLTQDPGLDPEDTEGMQWSPLQYWCLWTPLDTKGMRRSMIFYHDAMLT